MTHLATRNRARAGILAMIVLFGANHAVGQSVVRRQITNSIDPGTATEADIIGFPGGLMLAWAIRLDFNNHVSRITPALQRKLGISEKELSKIREIAGKRYNAATSFIRQHRQSWEAATREERAQLLHDFKQLDDSHCKTLYEALEELLQPDQFLALLRDFVEDRNMYAFLDPVVNRWIGFTDTEATIFKSQFAASQKVFKKGQRMISSPYERFPPEVEQEYLTKRAQIWLNLPEEKVIRCFQLLGYIDPGEDLEDFVRRFPEKADELAAEVPAFADAKKRVEQEPQKTNQSNNEPK